MATVTGILTFNAPGNSIVSEVIVRVWDEDFRSRELLGAVQLPGVFSVSATYTVEYSADRFQEAEAHTADVLVEAEATTPAGKLFGASEITFNARDNIRIDVVLQPVTTSPEPRLSELEQLLQALEPIRQGVEYADFTLERDIPFLVEELVRRPGIPNRLERIQLRQRLEFLRLADQLARTTQIPLAAFYGWFRKDLPTELNPLLDLPIARLREALEAAIRENIIPDITAQIPEILDRIRFLRFQEGRLVSHRFVGLLLDDETDQPLAGYSVRVDDLDAEPDDQAAGTLYTDGQGFFVLNFVLPGDAPEGATRRLLLTISEDETENLAVTEVLATANQDDVAEIRVRLRDDDRGNVPIQEVAPIELAQRLQRQGITTLQAVLANPDLTDDTDPLGLERLRAMAKLRVLTPNLDDPALLLESGNLSLLDVGRTTRADFVRTHHERLGDAQAASLQFAAKEYRKVMSHLIGSAWLQLNTTPDDEDDENGNDNIPPGVRNNLNNLRRCDCRNCQSAVSPGAYLAHLLDWTLDHIRDGTVVIEFDQLEEEFHQPLRDLPTSCQAVEERVRQVRICVEVLWRYTGLSNDPEAEDEDNGGIVIGAEILPARFQQAYTEFLNGLYQAILANLGTSYDQLRRVQLHLVNGEIPPEELNDPQRQAVADLLGIDVPHLNDVFLDIYTDETEVTELQLQTIFGFKQTQSDDVLKPPSRADLITWQRERLELIWQQQDWMNDAYSEERSLPLIDPILIDQSYLRQPLETNPAFSLLQERQAALANHRQQLVNANPQENGLLPLLENELGQPIAQLRTLHTTLQTSNDAIQLEPAQATVASFNLTLPAFTYLMDVDARIENQQAIAPTEPEVAQVWENVFEILSSAHRRSLFPAWIEAENQADILLSPKLFWLPLQTPPAPNSWQATVADRQVWEEALRDRYTRRPIIDPNQIKPIHLTVYRLVQLQQRLIPGLPISSIMPPLDTYELWQERNTWVTDRLAALEQAREGQNTHLADFEAMLAASTLGGGLELFDELADLEAQRGDLVLRLEQLNLTLPEYRYLTNILKLAENNASIAGLEWQQVGAILVNAEKRREFFEWRLKEQAAEITLHPHRFQQLKKPIRADRNSPLRWLSDTQAQEDWEDLLRARYDQFDTLTEALARAVSDAEGLWLPKLRDALILESNAPGDRLLEKADWLDKRLLVDMQMSGCHTTTRVSQAIETLQRFVRGVYTGEHPSIMQHLKLDSEEDYETEWPILGSYPTWRAFMLTYLFPENLLHVSPPLNQSFGFTELKRKLPSQVAPEDACVAAAAYSDYYRDVCHLEVQASCQVLTRMSRSSACESSASDFQVRVHLFAIATTSGKVYTATFNPALARDLDSTWQPINRAGIVEQIIGAVPHTTPDQQRFILLFIKVEESGKYKLKFIKRNLDELGSWSNLKDLSLPLNDGRDFTAASIQKRVTPLGRYPNTDFPTVLAIQSSTNDIIYLRHISPNATGWSPEEWLPLSGPYATKWRIDRYSTSTISLKALIQYSDSNYAIFSQTSGSLERVIYRLKSIPPIISPLREIDDLEWRWTGLFGLFHGAFTMTGSSDIFIFAQEGGITDYTRIRMNSVLFSEAFNSSRYRYEIRFPDDIKKFDNEWLKDLLGISLGDFNFSNFNPSFFVPKTDPGNFDPFIGKESGIESSDQYGYGGFNGSLLDLLTLLDSDFKFRIPEDAFVFSPDNPEQDKGYYKVQLQFAGVEVFLKFIEKIDQVDFLDENLRIWKLANHYIQLLSEDRLSLAALVGRILDNVTLGWINSSPEEVVFFDRDSGGGEDRFESGRLTNYSLLPVSGGDGLNISQTPRRAVVVSQPEGTFITTARRQGEGSLRWDNRYRITPNGSGPFDLTPLREKQDLETRGIEIRDMYIGDPGLVGSPASVMMYLKEAYNLVPIYLGYQLQISGYYDEALLWYRQVFDYLQVPNRRKIDYSLRLEEDLPFGFRDSEEWLDDATNAHAIAATRKETYTRHVLLLIIRCLIDYGDRLFSHDNVTDNARAKELYILALKLLDLSVLRPGRSSCGDTIGTLEIEVGDTEPLPIAQLQVALAQIRDPNRLRAVVNSLRAIQLDTSRSSVQRLTAIRETVQTALAEIPPPKKWNEVRTEQQSSRQTLENHYLAQRTVLTGLQKVNQQRYQVQLNALETISETPAETLLQNRTPLPWLRQARPEEPENGARPINRQLLLRREVPQRIAVLQQIRQIAPLQSLTALRPSSFAINQEISFEFCIPQNPVITALRTRAENNLAKLRQCRNIAGLVRQIDPYGAPIEIGGIITPTGQIFSGIVEAPPTIYRYAALIARAKELVDNAQRIESGYQAALESAEREALTRMQAEQSVELADARISLQDLRLNQVNNELGLAQLQRSSAEFREQTYAGWIAAGQNEHEKDMLAAYKDAADAQKQAARANAAASVAQLHAQAAGAWSISKFGDVVTGVAATQTAFLAAATASTLAGAVFQERAIDAEARAQAASFEASFERRNDEWQLQQGLSALDMQIGNQQIAIAEDQIAIVEQEKAISVLEQTHAADVLEYLLTKNFTEEMYLWIASVLQDVYRFFLQEAASIARLAQAHAAFRSKTALLGVIQPDYWQVPADSNNAAFNGGNGDRLGLTGSARLLKDIYQLDQYVFEARQREQGLKLTLDLAQLFPAEFQLFRETGVLFFETLISLIHRQFPGYYLCLIQQVSVSVVALIPPTYGIRASLTSSGTSRAVVGGDTFQTVTIRNLPERIALTSPTTTAGIIELEPDAQSLLRPFEGSGFDTLWEIRMPKAINPFDYNSMATILFTVELSALHSFDYEQQVLRELDNRVSANRAFQFRNEFADQWYDLNNPEQTSTPMVVRFETRRTDFPPNIENLRIQHVLLYFIRRDGGDFEVPVTHLHFTEEGSSGVVGGGATSRDGAISTRSNAASWTAMIGKSPSGTWELSMVTELEDGRLPSEVIENEDIEDILFVITYSGRTPEYPV